MVQLSKRYGVTVAWCLLVVSILFKPAFAQGVPNHALAQHRKLFLFIQGVDTSLPASDARNGTISALETFGVSHGLYPFLKATYPQASFLMFSYNGDNGKGIPVAYDCQDTVADKAVGYIPSNTLNTYAIRLHTQLQHYLAGKPATDVYLVSHSLGGVIPFGYLAYLKSLNALDASIAGTSSRVKGVITLDATVGGTAGGLAYTAAAFITFAQAGYPCTFLQKHHIFPSTAQLVSDIFQQDRSPIGGTNSVMRVVFGRSITNQHLAEEAARDGIQVLTVGNVRDFLFEPAVCHSPYENYLSSQWLADRGNTSGVYGRTFASGDATCSSLSHLDQNHGLSVTDGHVHQAIEQLVDCRPVTELTPYP